MYVGVSRIHVILYESSVMNVSVLCMIVNSDELAEELYLSGEANSLLNDVCI